MKTLSPLGKITWVLIGSGVAALALLVSYLTMSLQEVALSHWEEEQRISVSRLADRIDGELNQAIGRLRHLSRMAIFRKPPDPSLIDRRVNGIPPGVDQSRRQALEWIRNEEDHGFNVLFVLLPNGDHYLSHPFEVQRSLKLYNLSHRPYFQEATRTRQPVISDTFLGADGVPAVAIDVPIVDERGEITSHLGGVFHLAALTRLFKQPLTRRESESYFLLDRLGRSIARTERAGHDIEAVIEGARRGVLRNLSDLPPVGHPDAPLIVTLPANTRHGEQILLVSRLESGWILGVAADKAAVTAQFSADITSTALLAAALITVIIGMGILITHRIGLRWQDAQAQLLQARDELEQRVRERTAELSESEERFRDFADTAADWFWEMGPDLKFSRFSGRAQEVFGIDPSTAVGRSREEIYEINQDFESPQWREHFRRLEAREPFTDFEIHWQRPDGEYRDLAISGIPKFDQQGRFLGYRGVGRDITRLKQAEAASREREQEIRDLLNSTAEAIYGIDRHGRFTFANPTCLRLLGYDSVEQLIGRRAHPLIHHTHLDGSPYPTEECPIYRTFLTGEGTHVEHEVLWRADGSTIPVEYWSYPIQRDGAVTGAVVTFWDISKRLEDRRRAEQASAMFRNLVENLPGAAYRCLLDEHWTMEFISQGIEELSGYPAEEFIDNRVRSYASIIHPADRAQVDSDVRQAVAEGRPFVLSYRILHASGEERWIWERGRACDAGDGAVTHLEGVLADITETKRTERALRRAQKMDAIGQMAGGIAHDFNNILGIILGNVDLLERQLNADSSSYKRVETIKKSAQRAADLTKQLLGFSRRQATEAAVCDINRLIGEMGNLIARSVTPEVVVEYHLTEPLWRAEIDRGDFEDALLNLIINARDAMPGGGRLTLETQNWVLDQEFCAHNPGSRPGEYVLLMVSDTGEGISPEQQEHIFEPFFTTKPQGKGTGLGLAMVFGFVKRSRGYIKVESEPGRGTTFRIFLPRAEGEEQPSGQFGTPTAELPRGTETILVVDDEEGLRELAQASLQGLGYRVLAAGDGKRALEILATEPGIDLLFSDVVMPGGINGYELAEQATRLRPEIKVLLTSGYTEKAVAGNGQARFSANLLSKPYTQAELAQRLRVLLGESRSLQPPEDNTPPPSSAASLCDEWSETLSVGVEAMDNDHRTLLALLRRARKCVEKQASGAELGKVITELMEFTRRHFRREEAVMKACAYPGADNHRQVHELLTQQVDKMHRQLLNNQLHPSTLILFLTDWWINHIQGMDRAYAPYCSDHATLIEDVLE
ncbi:MAG: hypothetical protein Kow006_16190 [Gammaproteobacteria bacterium]